MKINKINSKTKIMLIVGLFVISLVIVAYFGSTGNLSATSTPTPIKVRINNVEYQTPFHARIKTGEYQVEATKEGYIPISSLIKIKPFGKTEINFPMIVADNESISYVRLDVLTKLPLTEDHFRIEYTADSRELEIIPRIPYYSEEPPTYYFKTYWAEYTQYGKEGLKWLEDNGLGEKVRKENEIILKWFGAEWWPEGVSAPSL